MTLLFHKCDAKECDHQTIKTYRRNYYVIISVKVYTSMVDYYVTFTRLDVNNVNKPDCLFIRCDVCLSRIQLNVIQCIKHHTNHHVHKCSPFLWIFAFRCMYQWWEHIFQIRPETRQYHIHSACFNCWAKYLVKC